MLRIRNTSGPGCFIVKELLNQNRKGIILGFEGDVLEQNIKQFKNVEFLQIEEFIDKDVKREKDIFFLSCNHVTSDSTFNSCIEYFLSDFIKNDSNKYFIYVGDDQFALKAANILSKANLKNLSIIIESQIPQLYPNIDNSFFNDFENGDPVGIFNFNDTVFIHFPDNDKPSEKIVVL